MWGKDSRRHKTEGKEAGDFGVYQNKPGVSPNDGITPYTLYRDKKKHSAGDVHWMLGRILMQVIYFDTTVCRFHWAVRRVRVSYGPRALIWNNGTGDHFVADPALDKLHVLGSLNRYRHHGARFPQLDLWARIAGTRQ